jgi:peptide/nickel transport system substrate-binding protein
MKSRIRLNPAWKVGAALAAGSLIFAACGNSNNGTTAKSTTTPTNTAVSSQKIAGGTVYAAEGAAAPPNYIFPFASLQFFSVTNFEGFMDLMYRPLYWFGSPTSTAPDVDYALSPANQPVWSNNNETVTISLKGWKFEDGQSVDAQSVIFWLNMMKAEADNWAGTAPGSSQFPQNITSYSAPGGATGNTVVINLDAQYSTNWYQYNELSQIWPMAEAWDVTSLTGAAGSGGCGAVASGSMTGAATTKACTKVWTFITDDGGASKNAVMAGDESTYATNPLWRDGVDGPWNLTFFSASSGEAKFQPNTSYSGPGKPIISEFVLVPYASTTAEYNALAAGGATAPQLGYLPSSESPPKPANACATCAGPNASALSSHYNLYETEAWQINYYPENFDSTAGANGHAGAVFHQLYFRQALQDLVDQEGIIKAYFLNYGVPTVGPAPVEPPNNFVSTDETENGGQGPYPFNLTNATNLLTSHGWTIHAGGSSVCAKPGSGAGECGAGIPAGTPLNFSEVYASGDPTLTSVVTTEKSDWSRVGINVSLNTQPFDNVLKIAAPCPAPPAAPTKSCEAWDMANWGGGWLYSPDYLPTGEEIFATGAGSNSGNYNDTQNNSLIVATNKSSSLQTFYTWENYLAVNLPVIWQPLATGELEVAKNLGGVTPVNALDNSTPEYYYLCKTTCAG